MNVFYGARAPKIAAICKCSAAKAQKLIDTFWEGNKGVKDLVDYLERYYDKYGFIKGLDGRKTFIRAKYKLLNSLIQTAAGIVFKKWDVLCQQSLRENNIGCKKVISYHDELDFRCDKDHVESATKIIKNTAILAGEYFKLHTPITVDVKVGANWAEVH